MQRSKVFGRKVDAKAHAAGVETSKTYGTYVDPTLSRQRFDDFVVKEWVPAQDWKETTLESWPGVWARLQPLLGGYPLGAIDQLALKAVRTQLAKRYAHATVKLTMAYAGMVLRAAYASGRIGRDPTAGLKAPRARATDPSGKVKPEDVPTRPEALALLDGAPGAFRAAVALGMAGLRVGEVLGMTDDRLTLDQCSVTVDRQLQRISGQMTFTTPKAEKVRTIAVPDLVAEELRRHLRDHVGDGGLLFRGVRGALLRRDQFYASAWKPALMSAGICDQCKADGARQPREMDGCPCRVLSFKFHSLRHWCASTLLAEGAPLTAVAGHLGDTVETVARIYVHWLRDDRDIPAEVLNRVLTVR
jgi:integrase